MAIIRENCVRDRGLILALVVMNLCLASVHVIGQTDIPTTTDPLLSFGFYATSCPRAERIVRDAMHEYYLNDPRHAPAILRLFFHDCFVQGCDASVLLDTADPKEPAEKEAAPNLHSLRGFELIDDIKSRIEAICPRVVSCADIIALAARESVLLTRGPRFAMLTGRRDARTSSAARAQRDIPLPDADYDTITKSFRSRGLNEVDVAALLGAHTIGRSQCKFVRNRNVESTTCSNHGNHTTDLDIGSGGIFDNHFFVNLRRGRGILTVDDALMSRLNSYLRVTAFAYDNELFFDQFVSSLLKMSSIGVLTGVDGEIRQNCSVVNGPGPLNPFNDEVVTPRHHPPRHPKKPVVISGRATGSQS
ncbi:peroxidase [Marchantia polymorpha subsp. ruderalis]|uniref:Peroxidase n=1 Tax=Marchantia polymorpha TaxID=3197 RepID=A0A2R6W4N7_MARPO|nr:hypothetical protein MARPO_0154s0038 [Marchantia polymorpha]PTQ28814.1 hypothetical protein MARPO_0154s0038 [Marchantia polymorpha]BBN20079.1 hypothetical protein Mp_8g16260 [Marchantia polymorpha subsp. ruderalis]BBN20080.1 hypothetical protein Mp_8g16260 [Marchantia polymorpha subsp. ruderalis]|eukprot:PTQ28813.1 hypothetical protein MARPO_0154s0038 [Marchantia polymorpha]